MATKKVLFKNLVEVVDENYQGGKGYPLNRYPIRPFQNVAPVEDFLSTSGSVEFINKTVEITGAPEASLNITSTDSDITAVFEAGTFEITISSGKDLIAAHLLIKQSNVQFSADAGGFTQWVKVRFKNTMGNSSITDIRVPQVQKLNIPASGSLSESNSAAIDNDNNPFVSVVECDMYSITIRVSGLNIGGQGYLLSFTGF